MVRVSIEVDLQLLDTLHKLILKLERQVLAQAHVHDLVALHLLRSVPGIGKVLALVFLYEIQEQQPVPKISSVRPSVIRRRLSTTIPSRETSSSIFRGLR
jgi:hypothetical protein